MARLNPIEIPAGVEVSIKDNAVNIKGSKGTLEHTLHKSVDIKKEDNVFLDIGCGTGLLGISSLPFIGKNGKYIGIDVSDNDIDYCLKHYPKEKFEFIHFDINNPRYAPKQKEKKIKWPIDNESVDFAMALSVWTHLNEADALFYFREINRILKPGGKAIITFFLLDETYTSTVEQRSMKKSKFHMTSKSKWIFEEKSYGSDDWLKPKWATTPESAIGITKDGLDRLVSSSELSLISYHPGNWKEIPGAYFQDVLIFQKKR